MDVTNFKFNLRQYSKIEDRAERLFFLRDLEKSLRALPKEQQKQLLKEPLPTSTKLIFQKTEFTR